MSVDTFPAGKSKNGNLSHRNHIEQMSSDDMVMVFSILLRSRVLIDFHFYKAMKDLEPFKEIWCYNSVLCVVKDDNLQFAQFLENAGSLV